ncbi:MAG: T9SS type A sorting domain-containing protein [Bacteroidetes bacterium]|nr:T9SS type A sorting domain-containing protein [Bacteroidota bacterium]
MSLRAYPNPTLGQFSITNNPLVKKVVLFNILGKQVKSFQHMNGNQYDISGVPDGLYLVSMLDAKGQTLKTVRMTKRAIRP